MARYRTTPLYVRSFTVEGNGEFPFDMLRYDHCHPASEADSYRLATPDTAAAHIAKRRVTLTSCSPNEHCPTYRRWESFDWKVVEADPF